MEVLSEHLCQGWLEGYLLTGRHGLFNCYEAFIHIVDSMFNQHAKWLKSTRGHPVAAAGRLAELPASSHVWRQDHNGFSHQDPGFIDHVVNKKADGRPGLPAAGRQHAAVHVRPLPAQPATTSTSSWPASSRRCSTWRMDDGGRALHPRRRHLGVGVAMTTASVPDVVMACAGDIPTLETLAAVDLIRQHLPELKVRVVNVVDLMRLQPESEHPHGMSDREFDTLFTADRPVIFAYHGYPALIHRLTYRRTNHANLHVRGFKEEGTTTTPFDMVMLNDLDRFRLVMDVIDRVPGLGGAARRAAAADGRRAARRPGLHPRARRGRAGDQRLVLAVRRRPATGSATASHAGRGHRRRQPVAPAARTRWRRPDEGPGRQHRLQLGQAAAAVGPRADRLARPRAPSDSGPVGGADADRRAGRRRCDGVDGVGHRVVHGGRSFTAPVVVDDDVRADAAVAGGPGAAAPAGLAGRAGRGPGGAAGVPSVACFDTAFHATHAAGGDDVRAAGGVAGPRRSAGTASTACPTRTRPAGRRRSLGAAGRRSAAGQLPPRRRRLAVRRPLGTVGGHHDGLHPAGGAGDGDPVRLGRPGAGALAAAAARASADEVSDGAGDTARGWSGWPAPRTCARC